MSKYIKAYETLFPGDPIERDDPRRPMIVYELKLVRQAKTLEAAARLSVEFGYADLGQGEEFAVKFLKAVA